MIKSSGVQLRTTSSVIDVKIIGERVGEARGELKRHLSPKTVSNILKNLPLEGWAALWKGEVYFKIPLVMGPEKARRRVEEGILAYWPLGSAICVFYKNCQPYSPVNIIGEIKDNLDMFKEVREGIKMRMEKIYDPAAR